MIFFLIPVFNEADNIPNLRGELGSLNLTEPVVYVFSDDGSTDSTRQVIANQFYGTDHIVLGDGVNRGPGAAFNYGFKWILEQSPDPKDLVITLEADCTSDLGILPAMLVLARLRYDLVLASVYAQGGGFEKTTFVRILASTLANFGFRFLFNVKTLTLSSFYRIYRVSLLEKIKTNYAGVFISEKGFVSMLEILMKAIAQEAEIIEVPMRLHSSKRVGRSKMKVFHTASRYILFLFKTKWRGL